MTTPSTGWVDQGGAVGERTRLWHQAQVAAGARVGAYIGTGAILGNRVKVGNNACVFGANVADEVMLCPGVLLLEDAAPRATTPDGRRKGPGDYVCRPVTVERGATIGAAAVIAPGVTIVAYALVAIGAVVVRDVPAYALVAGNPARPCGWVCICGPTLDPERHCTDCGRSYTVTEAGVLTGQEPPA